MTIGPDNDATPRAEPLQAATRVGMARNVSRRLAICVTAVAASCGCGALALAADAVPSASTASPAVPGAPVVVPASVPAPLAAPAAAPRPLGPTEGARYMRHLARELRMLVRDTPIGVETLRNDRLRLRIPANWLFRSDAPALRADALVRLDALALALAAEAGASTTLEISGHSDSLGTREFNNAFTLRRAEALRDYLAGKGVAMSRIRARGSGESELLEKQEDTPAARQRNRRVEVEIRPLRPSRRAAS